MYLGSFSGSLCFSLFRLLTFLMLVFVESQVQSHEKVLCVDVGATRIKWAMLNDTLSYDDLRDISVSSIPTTDWLSFKLPDLFLRNGPILNTTSYVPKQLSLAIRGPIYAHSLYLYRPRGIPYNLADLLQQTLQIPICVENDGVSFTCGAIKLLQLQGNQIEFPLMTMTLGTGLGIMIAENPQKITGYELARIPEFTWHEYNTVFASLFGYPDPQWSQEGPLGWRMLRYFPSHWDEAEKNLAYRKLFRAALADFNAYFQSINIDVKTMIVGQGNSRFLEENDRYCENVTHQYLFNPQNMQKMGLSPDLLSVLGPWTIVTDYLFPGNYFPPYDDTH